MYLSTKQPYNDGLIDFLNPIYIGLFPTWLEQLFNVPNSSLLLIWFLFPVIPHVNYLTHTGHRKDPQQ